MEMAKNLVQMVLGIVKRLFVDDLFLITNNLIFKAGQNLFKATIS